MSTWANLVGMGRVSSDQIELTESERAALEAAAGRLTGAFRDVQRARIVLYAADGLSNVQIAARLDTSTSVVAKWRRRFCEGRVEGLADQPRTGRPCVFSPGAGRRGQGRRVRATQDPRAAAVALQPR